MKIKLFKGKGGKRKAQGACIKFHQACNGRASQYKCEIDGKVYNAYSGDDAIWVDQGGKGLKIIPEKGEEKLKKTANNLKDIAEMRCDLFPKIHFIKIRQDAVLVSMDKIKKVNIKDKDKATAIKKIFEHQLLPEDEWYKKTNMYGNKIIDFHRFKKMPERYYLPTNCSTKELENIHKTALKKYKERGDNKWKGKIYQGMYFKTTDGTYEMPGYSSDGQLYDSYIKLAFCYMNKAKDKRVLDIGCNEGFFSAQAAIHGAEHIDAIDLCKEDLWLAENICKHIDTPVKPKFIEGNAKKIVENDILKNKYGLVFLLSVIHQIFPQCKGFDNFMKNISRKSDYVVIETPINHPEMSINANKFKSQIKKFFKNTRLLYTYNAYSSGSRALFICYNVIRKK